MVVTLFHILLEVLSEVHQWFLYLAVELWRRMEKEEGGEGVLSTKLQLC